MSNSDSLVPLLFYIGVPLIIGIFILGIIDMNLLIKRSGKIRRGVRIRKEPLPPEMETFLRRLSEDIVVERQLLFFKSTVGFIRKENGEVLIQSRRRHWGTSWPYVGYVDLRQSKPVLELRASLPMHLFLLPFVLTGIGIPFVGLLMILNYLMEKGEILNFMLRQSAKRP